MLRAVFLIALLLSRASGRSLHQVPAPAPSSATDLMATDPTAEKFSVPVSTLHTMSLESSLSDTFGNLASCAASVLTFGLLGDIGDCVNAVISSYSVGSAIGHAASQYISLPGMYFGSDNDCAYFFWPDASAYYQSSDDCKAWCENDAYCLSFTFIPWMTDSDNCLLYSLESLTAYDSPAYVCVSDGSGHDAGDLTGIYRP